MRGLKLREPSCRITKDFDDTELFEEILEDLNSDQDPNNYMMLTDVFHLRPSACLPKTRSRWKLIEYTITSETLMELLTIL